MALALELHNIDTMAQDNLTHLKYRPDIDGLRAVAVLVVAGFHLFPNWIKGGFIGVDIFFVISGFLISSIIFGNLESNSFSYKEFYFRRIRRIFPSLFLVLLCCLVFGWFLLLMQEYKQLGKHVAAGSIFVSNFLLWRESGYFDTRAITKPLLHLWSLGIEEQFYLFWPLFLGFVCKRGWRFLTVTVLIALISFAINIYTMSYNPVAAFYSPLSRFWELMIGSILAYMAHHNLNYLSFKPDLQSGLGALLITLSLLFIDKDCAFPGYWALLPTIGTFLIISAGFHASLNKILLSNKLMVSLGKISYPLYLWHWPLISFLNQLDLNLTENQNRIMNVGILLISITLAWITYKFLENPIRFGKYKETKAVTLCLLIATLGYVGYILYENDGVSTRFGDEAEYLKYFENSAPELNYFKKIAYWQKNRVECDFYDAEQWKAGHASVIGRPSIDQHCYTKNLLLQKQSCYGATLMQVTYILVCETIFPMTFPSCK